MAVYKFFVDGPRQCGKTELIKAASDLPLVSVVKKVVATQTRINLDYGRVHIAPHMCYFYGATSKVQREEWLSIIREMNGLIFIVDGTDSSLSAATMLRELLDVVPPVTVIGLNGAGRPDFSEHIYSELVDLFGHSYPVLPFDAVVRSSSMTIVRALIAALESA